MQVFESCTGGKSAGKKLEGGERKRIKDVPGGERWEEKKA